jgi:hypothetical protein
MNNAFTGNLIYFLIVFDVHEPKLPHCMNRELGKDWSSVEEYEVPGDGLMRYTRGYCMQ